MNDTTHRHALDSALTLDLSGRETSGAWAYREEKCACGAVRVSIRRPDRTENRDWVPAEKWGTGAFRKEESV